MITAVVQFQLPTGTSQEDVYKASEASTSRYKGMRGLLRKYYLIPEQGVVEGAYLSENRDAAAEVLNAERQKMVKERCGSEPNLSYYDTAVVVDNVFGG